MKENKRILIIIPTYNEVDNMGKLIPIILEKNPQIDILVIDDNSPDGTGRLVECWSQKTSRVKLLKRDNKMGLGTAYVAGFRFALKSDYDFIFEMDADFSHDPKEIPCFLESIKDHDLVIGSRYIKGINVVNWPLGRILLSWFASLYTRIVTGMPIHDVTSGYKCFRKEVLQSIDLDKIYSDGYAFQVEMHFKVWRKGFKIKEIPIVFVDRCRGVSKMNSSIIGEAALMVIRLRLMSLFRKL